MCTCILFCLKVIILWLLCFHLDNINEDSFLQTYPKFKNKSIHVSCEMFSMSTFLIKTKEPEKLIAFVPWHRILDKVGSPRTWLKISYRGIFCTKSPQTFDNHSLSPTPQWHSSVICLLVLFYHSIVCICYEMKYWFIKKLTKSSDNGIIHSVDSVCLGPPCFFKTHCTSSRWCWIGIEDFSFSSISDRYLYCWGIC